MDRRAFIGAGAFAGAGAVAALAPSDASSLQTTTSLVRVPSDYPTLQAAVDDLADKPGGVVGVEIETGHQPATGVEIVGRDGARIYITSADPVVTVASNFAGDLIHGERARMPALATVFDMEGRGADGYTARDGSDGWVAPTAGVLNAGGQGIYMNSSRVVARNARFQGAADRNIWVTGGSVLDAEGADFSANAGGTVAAYVSKGSIAALNGARIVNAFATALAAVAAHVSARDVDVSGAAANGIVAQHGAIIGAREALASGCGGSALVAQYASSIAAWGITADGSGDRGVKADSGSTITLKNGTVRGNGAADDLAVFGGSFLTATDCTTRSGSPSVGDTNVAALNTLSAEGAIFA